MTAKAAKATKATKAKKGAKDASPLNVKRLEVELARLQQNIRALLEHVAQDSWRCKSCMADVWLVRNTSGQRIQFCENGANHLAVCRAAKRLREGG